MNKDMDVPPICIISTDPSTGSGSAGNKSSKRMDTPMILMKKAKPQSVQVDLHLSSSTATPETKSQTRLSDKDVDSALLSALRDNRERMALLRLEQTIIDFMMDKNCEYMDVGGPFNSIAIKGTIDGVDLENCISRNCDYGGRQTSFQRLCLHRLADRFKIIREQIQYPPTDSGYYSYGLIRLVKTKESRIPKVKLLGIDLSHYDSPDSYPESNTDLDTNAVAERLAQIEVQERVGKKNESRKKKMEQVMIMKRNHNGLGDRNDKSTKTSGRRREKGKEFTDKEQAYAEARARIFASNCATSNEDSDHALPSGDNTDSETILNSTGHSFNSSPTDQNEGSQANNDDRFLFPNSTSAGYNSKVTWRNREQEASDPDFRRSRRPTIVTQTFGQRFFQDNCGNHYQDFTHAEKGEHTYMYTYSDVETGQLGRSEYSSHSTYIPSRESFQENQDRATGKPSINSQSNTAVWSAEEFPALR